MRASAVGAGNANWPRVFVAMLFAVVMVLWVSSGVHAALAILGAPLTHAYDAPISVYDAADHSAHVHADELAPAGLENGFYGSKETAVTATGPLTVVLLKSVAANSAEDAVSITTRYSRPSGATTRVQREAVQGQPCVECGNIAERQVADHIDPLVKEYYRTGTIDLQRMRSLEAVQPQCPICSARQGALLSRYSIEMRRSLGLE